MNTETPIGTIITSMIPPLIFPRIAGEQGGYNPVNSKWVPADGRDVSGSLYAKEISTLVPDLRGMFLRGLNYSEDDRVRTDEYKDPDGAKRKAGDQQLDCLKNHEHTGSLFSRAQDGKNGTSPTTLRGWYGDSGRSPIVASEGGAETRPKNTSVYYYIRIN